MFHLYLEIGNNLKYCPSLQLIHSIQCWLRNQLFQITKVLKNFKNQKNQHRILKEKKVREHFLDGIIFIILQFKKLFKEFKEELNLVKYQKLLLLSLVLNLSYLVNVFLNQSKVVVGQTILVILFIQHWFYQNKKIKIKPLKCWILHT